MIDLARTRSQMLAEIAATTDDPAGAAHLRVQGTHPADLVERLTTAFGARFPHVPARRLTADLTYLVRKGVGNAYKWGNRRDPAKAITVDAVATATGAVVAISDEGDGFDPSAIVARLQAGTRYFTHGGAGFKNFNRTRSVVSWADGGRTLLIRFLCPAPEAALPATHDGGSHMKDKRKVSIVSYPKSGRTWLRVLVGKALCDRFGIDEQVIFDKHKVTEATGLHISYTHEDAGISKRRPFAELGADKSYYLTRPAILLVRNPYDVLVSCYCHLSRRTRTDPFEGTISEFIRSERYGIEKILTYYNIWAASLPSLPAALVVRYEDLHADPKATLRQVLDFIGAAGVDDRTIAAAVEYASFKNMKRLEESNHFESRKMKPGRSEDDESFKVRRGVVGGYREYLGPDDCAYIQSMIDTHGCAFYPTARPAAAGTPAGGML